MDSRPVFRVGYKPLRTPGCGRLGRLVCPLACLLLKSRGPSVTATRPADQVVTTLPARSTSSSSTAAVTNNCWGRSAVTSVVRPKTRPATSEGPPGNPGCLRWLPTAARPSPGGPECRCRFSTPIRQGTGHERWRRHENANAQRLDRGLASTLEERAEERLPRSRQPTSSAAGGCRR